jgi:hypothetical protein
VSIFCHLPRGHLADSVVAKTLRIGLLALTLALLAAILICSLAPSPNMREMPWIPGWIGEWADRNPNFRNFPVFAALSALLFFVVTFYQPLVTSCGRWRLAFGVFAASSLLGALLEVAQARIPGRWADPFDVMWSALGALVGVSIASAVFRLVSDSWFRTTGVSLLTYRSSEARH